MPNSSATTAAVLLRKYNIFNKADSLLDIAPAARMAAASVSATVSKSVSESASNPFASRLSYYIALACILLTVYFVRGSRKGKLNLPFYKAAKTKWIFSAEDLVRDSYNKVRDVGCSFLFLSLGFLPLMGGKPSPFLPFVTL